MKKFAVLIIGVFLLMNTAFAGGILTNSNQSAQFVRMLSRNASTDLDAVYFNPAGLTQLKDGFYFGLHNQTITQNRTINSGFPLLNTAEYKGKVFAPVFPTAFAVYKMDKWAFSAGFGPNGGGGSAKYDTGLPSFEKLISSIPASLRASGIPTTAYSTNISFEGSSVFWGSQLNGTYAINDMISVSAGVRVIMANNTYNGYLKDIMINPNYPAFKASYTGGMVSATQFFADGNTFLKGLATNSTAVATGLSSAISGGAPAATPLSAMPATTVAAVTQLLGAAGISATGMNIGTAAATLNAVAVGFSGKAATMDANSVATADKNVDTKQTGTGFTPMIGVDIHLDKLNIGLKYEMQTTLKLTNKTVVDGTGMFKDGDESRSDIPAILAAGADYKITDKLKLSGSYSLYFDKNVNWGGNVYGQLRTIDKNYVELAFGVEYNLTKNFAVSAGYLNSNTGVSEQYQSDFSYSNDSYTTGLGFQWNMGKKLVLDAGAMMTTYKDETKSFTDANFGTYKETYGKDTFTIAFGIGYKIF
jgi:long-chain fatty acid transport protein